MEILLFISFMKNVLTINIYYILYCSLRYRHNTSFLPVCPSTYFQYPLYIHTIYKKNIYIHSCLIHIVLENASTMVKWVYRKLPSFLLFLFLFFNFLFFTEQINCQFILSETKRKKVRHNFKHFFFKFLVFCLIYFLERKKVY